MIVCSRLGAAGPIVAIILAATVGRHSDQGAEGVILTIVCAYLIVSGSAMVWFGRQRRPLLQAYWQVTVEEQPSFVCRSPEVLLRWLAAHRSDDERYRAIARADR